MRTKALLRDALDTLLIDLEDDWCIECSSDRIGPCPTDGYIDDPKCLRFTNHLLLAGVMEECCDKILSAL